MLKGEWVELGVKGLRGENQTGTRIVPGTGLYREEYTRLREIQVGGGAKSGSTQPKPDWLRVPTHCPRGQ